MFLRMEFVLVSVLSGWIATITRKTGLPTVWRTCTGLLETTLGKGRGVDSLSIR